MSPNMKISLLTLVGSAAAAVPHYGAHGRFHNRGFVGPAGGWSNANGTQPAAPTGGSAAAPVNEQTTTLQETTYSTETIVSTIYATKSKSDAVGVADVSTSAVVSSAAAAAACGGTVYVTATEKVTVTVGAGGASSSSSLAPASSVAQAPSSSKTPVYVVVSPSPAPAASSPAASSLAASSSIQTSVAKEDVTATSYQVVTSQVASVPVSTAKTSAVVTSAAPSSIAPSSVATSSAAASSVVPSSSVAASSSAQPSSSSTPTYSGGKRGLAYRWDGAADCKSFASKMDAGFAWNWESDSRGDIGDIPFIPTLRTLADAGDWSTNVDAAITAGSSVVFGFNEVDKADQANLGVDAACTAWKTYMNPIATKHPNVQIVGPSVSSDETSGTGLDWLSQFKTQCPDAVYHAVNIHWYGYGTASFDEFKAHVDSAVEQFGKVWVTEFALVNRSVADSEAFLEKALAYLDSNANCEGYSYFAVGQFDSAFNMLGTGTALSEVGKIYVS
ncbi:hypothetical protein P280DRAFT_469761 [Massarina eburnea CBS 473.64]|uniref:Asl1-like glycosyl hydrolase catalytic domain-containing protein n=1 Tax=Massarina eburnea CBS 473.64 TaxID=1395130 RepID=A0A6A6RXG9_9PLEO|nr:hypothetical protein P280DRAFT_469761 [Massarina eburnea CBS 473.64]